MRSATDCGSYHCSYVMHGFMSGACAFDMSSTVASSQNDCTCCSRTDYGDGSYNSGACVHGWHSNVYGAYCAPVAAQSGTYFAVGYSGPANRRWMIDSRHHSDTTTGEIDFRVWVR